MDCRDIATTSGSVDAFLELEDRPLDGRPREVVPFIHRRGGRVHDVCTPNSGVYPSRRRAYVSVSWALPQALAS